MSGNARHRLLAAALCAAALVAAGCGGSTEYSDKYADAKKDFEKSSQVAAAKLRSSKSAGQYLKAASQFEASINALIARLEKLEPPGDAQKAHERLVAVLKDFARDFDLIRAARKNGDVQRIHQLEGKIVSDVGAVQSAQKELDGAL
jgi:sulfur relay (sulfurtransferase) DsrC/TusE family protein